MTTFQQLKDEVEEKIETIDYDWHDTKTNIRIIEDIRKNVDAIFDNKIPSAMHIAEVAVSANVYLQIRDFLMGLEQEFPRQKITTYLALLNDVLDRRYAVPTITVLSSYMYSMDLKDDARSILNDALLQDPDYALANLLTRVYDQNWPAETFTQMSKQLHSKVLSAIYDKETE